MRARFQDRSLIQPIKEETDQYLPLASLGLYDAYSLNMLGDALSGVLKVSGECFQRVGLGLHFKAIGDEEVGERDNLSIHLEVWIGATHENQLKKGIGGGHIKLQPFPGL